MTEIKSYGYAQIEHKFSGSALLFARCVLNEGLKYYKPLFEGDGLTEEQIDDLINLIECLQDTLHWGVEDKNSITYECFNWGFGTLSDPCFSDKFSPFGQPGLRAVINFYLEKEWLSSPTLEWVLINVYLRIAIGNYRDNVLSISELNRPKSKFEYLFKKAFWLLFGSVPFLMLAGIYWITFTNDWMIANLAISLYILYFSTNSIIRYIKDLRADKRARSILSKMVDLKVNISSCSWSPRKMLCKINVIEEEVIIPELSPIFTKMMKRDADIFNLGYFFNVM